MGYDIFGLITFLGKKGLNALISATRSKNTWQDAENLDDTHGYTSYIWIPEETFKVDVMKLHVYTEKFRAYSKSALAGGAQTKTSSSGGGQTKTSTDEAVHQHCIGGFITGGTSEEDRQMGIYDVNGQGIGLVNVHVLSGGEGQYPYTYGGATAHNHNVTMDDHTHDVTIDDHTHSIDFGIYEEAITDRTLSAKLYDPDGNELKDFGVILTGEDSDTLDLSEYFTTLKYGMYRVVLTASGRLRVRLVFYELAKMHTYY